jgi:hypothetical protein
MFVVRRHSRALRERKLEETICIWRFRCVRRALPFYLITLLGCGKHARKREGRHQNLPQNMEFLSLAVNFLLYKCEFAKFGNCLGRMEAMELNDERILKLFLEFLEESITTENKLGGKSTATPAMDT